MSDHMNHMTDDELRKLLKGLPSAKASSGFTQNLMRRLAEPGVREPGKFFVPGFFRVPAVAFSLVVAGIIGAAVYFAMFRHDSAQPPTFKSPEYISRPGDSPVPEKVGAPSATELGQKMKSAAKAAPARREQAAASRVESVTIEQGAAAGHDAITPQSFAPSASKPMMKTNSLNAEGSIAAPGMQAMSVADSARADSAKADSVKADSLKRRHRKPFN